MISDLATLAEIGPQTTILDPCIGEAALPKALVRSGNRQFRLYSYELDPRLADISDGWIVQTLSGTDTVVLGDFLTSDLAIMKDLTLRSRIRLTSDKSG